MRVKSKVVWNCVYRLIAEFQEFVGQPGGVADEFLQSLLEADGFLKDLITAVHTCWVG